MTIMWIKLPNDGQLQNDSLESDFLKPLEGMQNKSDKNFEALQEQMSMTKLSSPNLMIAAIDNSHPQRDMNISWSSNDI